MIVSVTKLASSEKETILDLIVTDNRTYLFVAKTENGVIGMGLFIFFLQSTPLPI